MDYFRQIREQNFELDISLSEAVYRFGGDVITIRLNETGLAECEGNSQCLDGLYKLLSHRPDLRVYNIDIEYTEDEERGTYASRETEEGIKFQRIRDWLFGDEPTFRM